LVAKLAITSNVPKLTRYVDNTVNVVKVFSQSRPNAQNITEYNNEGTTKIASHLTFIAKYF